MNGIIAFALRMRALMVALFVLVMIGGGTAFVRLNIEAYPDPVPPLVDIVTQNPGQSAEEIERYITILIEVDVAVAPYFTAMRTISLRARAHRHPVQCFGSDRLYCFVNARSLWSLSEASCSPPSSCSSFCRC